MSEKTRNLLRASEWELEYELPAAVVEIARRRAGSDDLAAIVAELAKMSREGDSWPSRIALELLNDAAYFNHIAELILKFNIRLQEWAIKAALSALGEER
ncbi:MAG: hypothetical protein RXO54_05310 [Acidilobus sp.]|jgi:hypothetical protein